MNRKDIEMLDEIKNKSIAFWQEEQAIILKRWLGVIELKQGKNEILISEYSVDEFIKAIRQCQKMEFKKVE